MARPRKPTAQLVITGTTQKNPSRLLDRAAEPVVSTPLGPPMPRLSERERTAWLEISQLAPWLSSADRVAVEIAACLLAAFRIQGTQLPPPLFNRLETLLGRLGMTPADRSKVADRRGPSTSRFANNGRPVSKGPTS